MIRLRAYAVAVLISLLICSQAIALEAGPEAGPVAPSGVTFRFVNEQAEQVELKSAMLLLVAWGYVEAIELEPDGDKLYMPCGEAWLKERAPERFRDLEAVYLYLDAGGYMKKLSEPIAWPGTFNSKSTTTTISVPGGTPVSVGPGENKKMPVVFRRPEQKFLRVVDEDGEPVADVHVTASLFWSQSNHCGRLAGAWKQAEGISGNDGLVEIPDGEYPYVFELSSPGPARFALAQPENSAFPRRIVTHLTEEITEVPLKLWKQRPLVMRITQGGEPLKEFTLQACLSDSECIGGVCGTCCGPFGTTDDSGLIVVPEFYPEYWGKVFVPGEPSEDWQQNNVYEADPNDWPEGGVVEVELPEGR